MKLLWIIYPFCSIFTLVGAGISLSTLRGILEAHSITHWPTVEATVTNCDFKIDHDAEDGESFEIVVEYTYTVFGQEYKNDSIHPAYSSSSFDGHRPLFERINDATVVRVRYNKTDPTEAYLITGSYSANFAAFFGGLIFLSAVIFFLLTFHFAIAGNSNYVSGLEVIR